LLNSEPVTDTNFTDSKFQYLVGYVYVVRALSQGANGLIESADSEPLLFTPVDVFAPAAPDPVSVASANGTISLFWPSSAERDVIGYNVYRAGSRDPQDKDWTRLNDQPVTTVTFRDELVVIDQVYFYTVTAVDRFNNESKRSRVVNETAHP
jgi:fibronectin type 3 domain-containing protein